MKTIRKTVVIKMGETELESGSMKNLSNVDLDSVHVHTLKLKQKGIDLTIFQVYQPMRNR